MSILSGILLIAVSGWLISIKSKEAYLKLITRQEKDIFAAYKD